MDIFTKREDYLLRKGLCQMKFQSCFDIIGPIMVGPSSSHTAGVVSIGKFIHELIGGVPEEVNVTFYDSFAQTYQGHGTDKALFGGLIGMGTEDGRIKYAIDLANEMGLKYKLSLEEDCPYFEHPNTTVIIAKRKGINVKVGGVSLGGGLSKIFMINHYKLDIRLSTNDDFEKVAKKYQQLLVKKIAREGA